MKRLFPWLPLLCVLVGAAPAPGATVVTSPVRSFAASSREPMLYPTAVAVDPAGRVWVADGARDRVLLFAADGTLSQTIRRVAGLSLSRPMDLAVSADGRVWIADAGNSRIAVTSAANVQESSFPLGKEVGKADLTGLAVAANGSKVWAIDNGGNRVLSLTPATGRWEARGSKGGGSGNFNHPRSVAVDEAGRTYVSDVLNGRVLKFDEQGRPTRPVVRYGVSPGQVFRPSGVAYSEGRVWVADSVLGVVQVFLDDGTLVDVVRDAQGKVLHLDGPIGIEVVGDKLYVAESKAAKVTELSFHAGVGAPLQVTEVKSTTTTASQGQECTLCHLDFIPPLDEGKATALVTAPEKKNGLSWAGTETACISCHDGAVMDSRKHIWSGYSHPTKDAKIPADMKIPQEMPLVDGAISCRTCHSPHTLGGSGQQHRGAVMLRADASPSEVCVACHGAKGGMK